MSKKVKLIILIFSSIALLMGANFVLAADFGVEPVSNVINLAVADPRVIIGRIIQIALSFLGAIALVLVMYAGFLWMTSNGDEEKITRAKQILKNAIIGLIIILSSWAITTFLLSRLLAAIGGGGNDFGGGGGSFIDPGFGAMGACTVETVYPENGQTDVARNSAIIITFKEEAKMSSVCINASGLACACDNGACNKINPQAIRIYKTELGDACASGICPGISANVTDATVAISSNNKTLVISPLTYLGNPTTNVWYSVKLTSDLKKNSDGTSMFKTCGTNYFNWKFEVGTRLDLTPPLVTYGGIFPRPDNEQDTRNISAPAKAATSEITVNTCPNVYKAPKVISVDAIGNTPQATATPLSYRGNLTKFKVVISSDSRNRAQLFDANDDKNLLGFADFDAQNNAKFTGYFILKAVDRDLGSAWEVTMSPEQLADTLTIGDQVYTFTSNPTANNNIYVNPNNCDQSAQAHQIQLGVSGNQKVDIDRVGSQITLTAKVAGNSGNKIIVNTTNQTALQIQVFQGGSDRQDLAQIKDKKDTPMNTVLQMNFSEAINPLKVAGLASEVASYIKVINYEASSTASSTPCVNNSDCKSYKCEGPSGNKVCVGDYIGGKFLVSNGYKTVEFVSDNECGVNGCGEKIYCLPANSHLAVEMKAADLKECVSDTDCLAFAPFRVCSSTPLGYKTCQNDESKSFPTAANTQNGIIDTAVNSFDGDRDIFADGPLTFYNDNFQPIENLNKKDNYRWSFYVNDKIMLTPPQIETVTPVQGATGVTLADPLRIDWNTLMMNSSLSTGGRLINNGSTTIEHKLINLKSSTPTALGYWINNNNIDTAPLDGEPDKTISWIEHTPLSESMSYRAQVGSGVRDIYQNCYKPSAGAGCPVTATSPSCCFGVATSSLNTEGNCK